MEDGVPRAKEVDAYHRAPERLDEARLEGELSSRAHLGLSISLFSQVDVSDFQDDGAESPHPQELQRTHANRTFSAQALRDWK